MLQKPVFALPGCQRMSVNTLLCDTLALADPRLRQNLVQVCCATKSDQVLTQKSVFFSFFLLLIFLKNLILPAERRGFLKKTKKRENLDQVLTQKTAIFGPSFDSTALACYPVLPFMASNYANLYLVPISFWSRSGCWPCLGIFIQSRFSGVRLVL